MTISDELPLPPDVYPMLLLYIVFLILKSQGLTFLDPHPNTAYDLTNVRI